MQDKYIIVKYLRLSSDDEDKDESNSITNQRNLLDYYISKIFDGKNYDTIELVDDGYTGTNMNRPGMKKLLILAETHSINCIIVKDLSRFARDYIDVGEYVEKKFPQWQIRFISLNDHYDSKDYIGATGGTAMALQNLTYTMYSRDLSEKIKSSKKIQCKQGRFLGSYAFYGYTKVPDDKTKIVIDEYAAENVRRIFTMRASGISPSEIALQFNNEGILTPAKYKKKLNPDCRDWKSTDNYSFWTRHTIGRILHDERYTGKLIGIRRQKIAVGGTKSKRTNDEDRVVVENAHEAIISKELFDSVQEICKSKSKPNPTVISLKGLVHCGGCGHKMRYDGKRAKNKKYFCLYANYEKQSKCFCGRISEKDLCDIIYNTLQKNLEKTIALSKLKLKFDEAVKKNEKKLDHIRIKISTQKNLKKSYYMRLAKNEITEQEFEKLRDAADNEIRLLNADIEDLQGCSISEDDFSFISLFNRYIGIQELNNDVVSDLIKAIYVYPDDRVEIQWNFSEDKGLGNNRDNFST